jgi:outer membrane protein assembly factor BamE (lipoprotein component of BamABCDE complex)
MLIFLQPPLKGIKSFLCLTVVLAFSCGCVKNITTSGYNFDESTLARLLSEESTKPRVQRLLGSPSATSDFGQETWYYIHREFESVAFLPPKLKSQHVMAIRFDESGKIVSAKKYDEANARNILVSKEITPTEGHDLSMVEQLLGNLGRFNSTRDVLAPRN